MNNAMSFRFSWPQAATLAAALAASPCLPALGPAAWAEEAQVFASDAGVPPQVEEMYKKGLHYLASSQKEDGTFPDNYGSEPGVVGLAGIAMLAHGDDPNTGPYAKNLRHCLDHIIRNQREDGYIGRSMYNQGFATLFLAEAYGQVNDDRIGPALHKAVGLILRSQAQNGMGAWRYSPDASDADSTVTGACTVALVAAANAGVKLPADAYPKIQKYLRFCQDEQGRIGYTGPGGGSNALTAIGVLCLSLTKGKELPAYRRVVGALAQIPMEDNGSYPFYGEYYRAQAEFRTSPEAWMKFNASNIAARQADQADDGSWNGNLGGAFSTSAALLSMALNYRYLPIYER